MLSLVLALSACSTTSRSPAEQVREPAPMEASPEALAPVAVSRVCPPPASPLPPAPPALADPSIELANSMLLGEPVAYVLAEVYPDVEGPPMSPRDFGPLGDSFWWGNPWVLDPGAGADDRRRVRFVCDEPTFRVAFWLAARALRRTNRTETLLVARPGRLRNADGSTPGVLIPAGSAIVGGSGNSGDAVSAMYDDHELLVAEGHIAHDVVDVVHRWDDPGAKTLEFDGVLTGPALIVRDTPRGAILARLSPDAPLPVKQLQRRADAVLVRVQTPYATVLGWVDRRQFESRAPRTELRQPKGGRGGVDLSGDHLVELPAGTLLVHEQSGHTLGVVKRNRPFPCDGTCDQASPRIRIGCGYELRLRAIRRDLPGSAAASCSRRD